MNIYLLVQNTRQGMILSLVNDKPYKQDRYINGLYQSSFRNNVHIELKKTIWVLMYRAYVLIPRKTLPKIFLFVLCCALLYFYLPLYVNLWVQLRQISFVDLAIYGIRTNANTNTMLPLKCYIGRK